MCGCQQLGAHRCGERAARETVSSCPFRACRSAARSGSTRTVRCLPVASPPLQTTASTFALTPEFFPSRRDAFRFAGQQRGRDLLAAATEANSAKKPARASAKRLLWSATRPAGRSPSTVPTPDVRAADVAKFQRTPTTTVRARPAGPRAAPGASPAAAATPCAPAADDAARRMSFAPPSPATHAAKPQTHASATPAARPTPARGAFPTPQTPGGPNPKSLPRVVTLRAPPSVSDADASSDASAPPSTRRSSTAGIAREVNGEKDASIRAEPEAPEAPGAAPATAAGFGPPVASNPFAAAAKAAARRLQPSEGVPAGTPEARTVPRLGEKIAEPREHLPSPHAPPSRVPGFVNLGNTCYLAATAQMLCGLDAFAGDLDALPDASSRGTSPPDSPGGVAGALRDLVRAREARAKRFDDPATRASATASLVPARLKRAVQRRHPRYEGYEQHDAHEFLCDTLDAVAEEVAEADAAATEPETKPARGVVPLHRALCPTRRAFTGASAVTLTCLTCGDESRTSESFRHLSLELPTHNAAAGSSAPLELQGLIARCFASETVERRCERAGCGGTRAAMARRLLRAPKALLVHLKRFRAENAGSDVAREAPGTSGDGRGAVSANAFAPTMRLMKDSRPVRLPETVTLAPFADAEKIRGPPTSTSSRAGAVSAFSDPAPPADEAAAATRAYADDDSAEGEAARAQLASYRLKGVVYHIGTSMRRGHYVASARVAAGDDADASGKRWMFFDDERASFAESPASSSAAPGDWYVAAFECEGAR